ncbi:MAG: hypothetical protein JWQ01_4620, partial [Massilia sp.]|nr:hypothetical protein [Massilia sp.]
MPPQIAALVARLKNYVGGFSSAQKTIAILGIA